MPEDLNDILETKPLPPDPKGNQQSGIKIPPISTFAPTLLEIIGYMLAFAGVFAGILILTNAPKGPSDLDLRFDSDKLIVQVQLITRLVYLSVGWSEIIGGIITGVFFYVVSRIGLTVLEIWEAHYRK